MKHKIVLGLSILVLTLAAISCNLPIEKETPSVGTTETETAMSTATITPSLTSTADVSFLLPVVTSPVIFELKMFTPTHGWALTQDNDKLLRTVNGGETWLDATPAELYPLPPDVTSLWLEAFFLDAETAWFTSNALGGELYHTRDGGVNWTTTAIPFEQARYYFLDVNLGYALVDLGAAAGSHYVAIYRTENSGETWTEVFTHEPGESKSLREGGSKSGITFLDVNQGWIGGNIPMEDHFYLYYSSDGGATWALETDISLPTAYAGSMLEVGQPVFMSDSVGYLPVRAFAPDGHTYLLVYRSDDGGQTWTFQNAEQEGNDFDFYSLDEGWQSAGTNLYKTIDGGITWTLNTVSGIPLVEFILKVDFVDDQHGWVLATAGGHGWEPLKLYRTSDGGTNWELLLP